MDIHSKALDSIFGDLDDLEKKKMFGSEPDGDEGTSITITISPGGSTEGNGLKAPEENEEMFKGGEAYHKGGMAMAEGGMVEEPKENPDEKLLPPFLRKKKKGM